MKKITFSIQSSESLKLIIDNISKFEFIENVEILYSLEVYTFKKIEIFFPKTMKNVKKIVIFSLVSEQTNCLKKVVPKNILYELQIRDYSKFRQLISKTAWTAALIPLWYPFESEEALNKCMEENLKLFL